MCSAPSEGLEGKPDRRALPAAGQGPAGSDAERWGRARAGSRDTYSESAGSPRRRGPRRTPSPRSAGSGSLSKQQGERWEQGGLGRPRPRPPPGAATPLTIMERVLVLLLLGSCEDNRPGQLEDRGTSPSLTALPPHGGIPGEQGPPRAEGRDGSAPVRSRPHDGPSASTRHPREAGLSSSCHRWGGRVACTSPV